MRPEDQDFSQMHVEPDTSSAWMLTFADLLSLILAFFVLLFATTSLKKPEWERVAESLSQRLNPAKDARESDPAADIGIEKITRGPAADLGYLRNIITEKMIAGGLAEQLLLQQRGDRLVISIAGGESFQNGSTEMTPQLQEMLNLLSQMLRTLTNRIEIHGNADASPPNSRQYPSNWELSLARAAAVGLKLRADGYPYRLSIYGRGDSAYKDMPEGLSPEKKGRLARRIDIIIRKERAEHHS